LSTNAATSTFTLEYVKTIGLATNQIGRGFINPYDVAFSRDGRIFVLNHCDSARKNLMRVGIVNLDEEEYLGEFGKGSGTGDDQFNSPVAMAFDTQDRLYVTDELNHRVTIFDASGKFLHKWDAAGSGDGEFNGPAGIAVDREDHVYIVDQHNSRIQKFTTSGKYLGQWGELGSRPGQFNLPWGVTTDAAGDVYVADWRNDRVQKFSPEGQFMASFGESGTGDGQFHRPSAVAVDAQGYVYVADWGNERVQVFDARGVFQLQLRGQATLSKWASDYLNVNPDEQRTREMSNLIPDLPPHLNTPHHISSQTEPYFWGPVSVRLDGHGRLFVTESNRHRFQVYQRS
jgi:DNA-binding beta-propeller fold protein YncE